MHPFNQFTQENTVFNSETTHVISVSDLNRTTRQLLEEAYGQTPFRAYLFYFKR